MDLGLDRINYFKVVLLHRDLGTALLHPVCY